MHRERLAWMKWGAVGGDAIALALLWGIVVTLRGQFHSWWPFDWIPNRQVLAPLHSGRAMPLALAVIPVWLATLHWSGSTSALRRKSQVRILVELVQAATSALMIVLAGSFLLRIEPVSRSLLLGFAALTVPTLYLRRSLDASLLRALRRRHFDPHRVLLMGDPNDAAPWMDAIHRNEAWGIRVVAQCGLNDVEALERLLSTQPVDEVYVTGAQPGCTVLPRIAHSCDELGLALTLDADFLGSPHRHAACVDYDSWQVVTFSVAPRSLHARMIKRALDIVIAAVSLMVLSPLMLGIASAIRVTDGATALYRQDRIGRNGRTFSILKFRTMTPGAHRQVASLQPHNEMTGPVFKMQRDPRVTRLGQWLRRWSLDELPQLINVLRGEMSLVGPRPPLPEEVARYQRWQRRRLSVPPGMTCTWQVSGRSDLDFDQWVALDLDYVDNWSLGLDCWLLLRTIPAVVFGRGAR